MKLSRQLAGGAAAALVGLIALPLGAATAAPLDNVYETIDAGTLPAETSPYATDSWFVGGGSLGVASTTVQGTTLDGSAGKIQIMRAPMASDTGLDTLANQTSLSVLDGDATFQVAVLYDHDNDAATAEKFTTLRPVASNTTSTTGDWTTSQGVLNADGSVRFEKNTPAAFFDLKAGLGASARVIAFGMFVDEKQKAVIESASFGRVRAQFYFDINYTMDEAKSSISVDTFKTSGAQFVFRNLPPAQTMSFYLLPAKRPIEAGGLFAGTFTADSSGVLHVTLKPPAGFVDLVDEWNIAFFLEGLVPRPSHAARFAVFENDDTANPPAVDHQDDTHANIKASDSSQKPTPTSAKVEILPVTGSDSVAAATFAGVLLSVGAALALFARRRAAAK